MSQRTYRDENFERYIDQIEVALERQLFNLSPVVNAVKRLRERLHGRSAWAARPMR